MTMMFDSTVIDDMFALDQSKLDRDVNEISKGDYFQDLQKRAKQLRKLARISVQVIKAAAILFMIISTHSFRGGTGKSNTTANLAVLRRARVSRGCDRYRYSIPRHSRPVSARRIGRAVFAERLSVGQMPH